MAPIQNHRSNWSIGDISAELLQRTGAPANTVDPETLARLARYVQVDARSMFDTLDELEKLIDRSVFGHSTMSAIQDLVKENEARLKLMVEMHALSTPPPIRIRRTALGDDLVDAIRFQQQEITGALGIPPEQIGAPNRTATAVEQLQQQQQEQLEKSIDSIFGDGYYRHAQEGAAQLRSAIKAEPEPPIVSDAPLGGRRIILDV